MMMTSKTRRQFKAMLDRVQLLAGLTAAQDSKADLADAFKEALDESKDKIAELNAAEEESRKLLSRARRGDDTAIEELNELRMEKIDLYIRASSQFGALMFETRALKDNEQAVYEHSYRNPIRIRYLGQDGGAHTTKAVKARKQVFVDMRELHSNELGYQMRDIQQGDSVADAAQGTVDISWDLTNKIDEEAFNMLQGGTINGKDYGAGVYGAFTTTGANLGKTYIANPRIQAINLPSTNDFAQADLDDSGVGQTNNFRLAVIRKIMQYCDSWGKVFGEEIRPTGAILIPSSESTQLSLEIKPTGTFYNQVAEGLLQRYTRFEYMGVQWTLIPDVTLVPGACFPVLNMPVGHILTKPSFDQEFVESNPRKNWETRSAMKVLAMYIAEPWRVRALRITYSSVANAGVVSTNE